MARGRISIDGCLDCAHERFATALDLIDHDRSSTGSNESDGISQGRVEWPPSVEVSKRALSKLC